MSAPGPARKAADIEVVMGQGYTSIGSIEGKLETVSVHGRPAFTVFDAVTGRAVRCEFPAERRSVVLRAMGHKVVVTGRIRRDPHGRPRAVRDAQFKRLGDTETMPSRELAGMFRGMDRDTRAYLAEIRGECEGDAMTNIELDALTPAQRVVARAMSEAELTEHVVAAARQFDWLAHHCRPARTGGGSWRTPIQGDAGFPDMCLARDGRVIFAELKREGKRPDAAQMAWAWALVGADDEGGFPSAMGNGGVSYYVWRPADWVSGAILAVLR